MDCHLRGETSHLKKKAGLSPSAQRESQKSPEVGRGGVGGGDNSWTTWAKLNEAVIFRSSRRGKKSCFQNGGQAWLVSRNE